MLLLPVERESFSFIRDCTTWCVRVSAIEVPGGVIQGGKKVLIKKLSREKLALARVFSLTLFTAPSVPRVFTIHGVGEEHMNASSSRFS